MTLIDRYVAAVRDHLPREGQQDIVDELADSLQSKMEDEAATRGRPLDEAEEVAILRAFGHPLTVAARYRGDERTVTFGRRLIGPELFPTYKKVLAINVIVTLILAAIAVVAGGAIGLGLPGIFVPLAIQFVIVTTIFVAIDRRWVQDPDGWDPRTVHAMGPDVDVSSLDGIADQVLGRARPRKGLASGVLQLGFGALLVAFWVSIGVPRGGTILEAGPGWADVFVAVAVVLALAIVPPLITIFAPTRVRLKTAADIVVDVATTAVAAASLAIGHWVQVVATPIEAAGAANLAEFLNGIVRVSLAATIVLTLVTIAFAVRRFVRLGATRDVASSE